jgi:hypothetical protein
MKYTVIIVGGGNIGSRHMQAFAMATLPVNLYIIDPSEHSLEVCKTRWEEATKGDENKLTTLICQTSFTDLPSEITLAIIATNAQHRFKAFHQLSDVTTIKYLILEKFLFNDPHEYALTEGIIQKRNIIAYVNCPRRLHEGYHFVKQKLATQEGPIHLAIQGDNWSMGSNAIHFLDLFCYLANDTLASCEYKDMAHTEIIPSKREGYIELFGTLTATTKERHTLYLTCTPGTFSEIKLSLQKGSHTMEILEKGGKCYVAADDALAVDFHIPFQSQLTNACFEQLVNGEKMELASYMKAVGPHLKFLEAVSAVAKTKGYTEKWQIT